MRDNDEWFYSELLDFLKEKEREKEESYYRQIELELPLYEPSHRQPIGDEKLNDDGQKDRGVIIIEL